MSDVHDPVPTVVALLTARACREPEAADTLIRDLGREELECTAYVLAAVAWRALDQLAGLTEKDARAWLRELGMFAVNERGS